MEPTGNRQSGSSSKKGIIVGTGIVCSFIGAVIGAVGYHLWKKEEEMQHAHSGSKKAFNNGTCPICLSDMEEVTILPCGHQYHETCTNRLKEAEAYPKCPICRKDISQ